MKKHILFEELTDKELMMLVRATERTLVQSGEKLLAQDELGECMLIVQKSIVSVD